MATVFSSTTSLIERDRACIWHPFTQMKTERPPIPIVKGEGVYLYSEEGRRYLDGVSSWWVNLHGHAHPYIAQKIKSQVDVLEHVMFAGFTHAPAVDLACRLLPILPGEMSKIFYGDNGSTAVEAAIKMALQYWHNQKIPKTKIVAFKGGYHGDTFGAMSVAGKNAFNRPFWNHLFEVEMIDPPIQGREKESLEQLQTALNDGTTACFIFEPLILGVGGMILYPSSGLNSLLSLCKQHDVLTIADEVMTGFGRTGPLFACDQLSVKPDMICLSKGLTGGFLPLGVTACTERIYNAFLDDDLHHAFLHGHSYAGNPLACTSALASLDLLQEETCASQRNRIASSHRNFCETWRHHPKLKRCESLGTILVVEYAVDRPSYFQHLRNHLYHFFLDREILLRPFGSTLSIIPPYCINNEELERIYDLIIQTIEGDL